MKHIYTKAWCHGVCIEYFITHLPVRFSEIARWIKGYMLGDAAGTRRWRGGGFCNLVYGILCLIYTIWRYEKVDVPRVYKWIHVYFDFCAIFCRANTAESWKNSNNNDAHTDEIQFSAIWRRSLLKMRVYRKN